ncbi:MAG: efflux RND transporter periplasmic adaptor subunit [Candidatus Omnitrophica bacterium]|nr:efflux RND transporter periplasmic adaptor subunit [Candidatus Omnitrophota bacterium]
MNNTRIARSIFLLLVCCVYIFAGMMLTSCGQKHVEEKTQHTMDKDIEYYTCGMHPSVHVLPEEYAKGSTNCPICNMFLIPVKKVTTQTMTQEDGHNVPQNKGPRVVIPQDQLQRAGVRTELVERRKVCKSIRTVGRIAYDPDLVVAEEELLSSLTSMESIQEGTSTEIIERARSLITSSKRKLRLLGLSEDQIAEISTTRQIQKGLILPEKTMWVYGDLYEFEISWVGPGAQITVTTESFPGEKFYGVVSAIDPVIDQKTRSVKFRAQVENPDLKLKPNMYVSVIIEGICVVISGEGNVIAVPKEAVLDTGVRKIVWVDAGSGNFERREIEIGSEGISSVENTERKFYPVFSGLSEGDLVVTKGNFLIDSQSQITGGAGSSYGGALGGETESSRPLHQH